MLGNKRRINRKWPGLMPSICMTCEYFEHLRIIYSKIMKSTYAWASLALVALLVTSSQAHCSNRIYKPPCPDCGLDISGAIASGAKVVTYGEPCTCGEALPYSVQVPKPVHVPVEHHKSYGFSVITPPSHAPPRHFQLPVQIQTPIHRKPVHDHLSGKSYGVCVEHQTYVPHKTYNYDFTVQKAAEFCKPTFQPSLDVAIEYVPEYVKPMIAPLPIEVQTPLRKGPPHEYRLPGLSTTVDKVLLPACPYSGVVPDCTHTATAIHRSPPSSCH